MNDLATDTLWPHFAPLWADLRAIAPRLLLAGGYGLFLKQSWLLVNESIESVIAVRQWYEPAPRVTNDFDLIAELDLIASPADQSQIQAALERHDFNVVPANARWQFAKRVGSKGRVVLEFHAPLPREGRVDLRVESRRIKPNPSLRQTGIHARQNSEAIGCALHPLSFEYDGVNVVIPNPVTLAIMKLTAMRDRWLSSQDSMMSDQERREQDAHAKKHAQDVCRVVAMATREEYDGAAAIVHAVRDNAAFGAASEVFDSFFRTDEGWGTRVVAAMWRPDAYRLIQSTLAAWIG